MRRYVLGRRHPPQIPRSVVPLEPPAGRRPPPLAAPHAPPRHEPREGGRYCCLLDLQPEPHRGRGRRRGGAATGKGRLRARRSLGGPRRRRQCVCPHGGGEGGGRGGIIQNLRPPRRWAPLQPRRDVVETRDEGRRGLLRLLRGGGEAPQGGDERQGFPVPLHHVPSQRDPHLSGCYCSLWRRCRPGRYPHPHQRRPPRCLRRHRRGHRRGPYD